MVEQKLKFNLIVTDPPYNLGKDFGNDTDCLNPQEFLHQLDTRLKLMKELLTPNGSIVVFCSQKYTGDIQFLLRKYFVQRRLMIWFYENGMSRQAHEPVTEFEPFWWFSASDDFTYNIDDVRVPYKTDRVRNPIYKIDVHGNKRAWTPDPRGRKRGDVWQYPTLAGKHFEDEKVDHPTQKPVSLWTDIIRSFSSKNSNGKLDGKILDPYMGSGTTAVCCEKLNRESNHKITWMGCELEQKFVDLGNSRIEKERRRHIEPDIFADEN
jgi:site-specific DNA-methyltransferase (adenine-specific)